MFCRRGNWDSERITICSWVHGQQITGFELDSRSLCLQNGCFSTHLCCSDLTWNFYVWLPYSKSLLYVHFRYRLEAISLRNEEMSVFLTTEQLKARVHCFHERKLNPSRGMGTAALWQLELDRHLLATELQALGAGNRLQGLASLPAKEVFLAPTLDQTRRKVRS